MAEIAAPRVLEPALVDDIVAKSDGVPLYVEELTKTVLESSTPDRPTVPATLHDSLMARLDRLGPAKDIAQVAAVIGQQFSHALLAAVVSYSAAELTAGLLRLVEAGLAYRSGRAGEASYSFKHALLRDVAYENLLRPRRRQLHERIGRASWSRTSPRSPNPSRSFSRITSTTRGSSISRSRTASAPATAPWRGRPMRRVWRTSPRRSPRRRNFRWDRIEPGVSSALLLKLGPPITIIKGAQSPEAGEVYRSAQERASASDDETGLFKATWGLWYTAVVGRRLDLARDRAVELIDARPEIGQ